MQPRQGGLGVSQTMSKGISFASVHDANQHAFAEGYVGDTQLMARVLGGLLNCDASIYLLAKACSVARTVSAHIGVDITESSAARCTSSKHPGATAMEPAVQRSR